MRPTHVFALVACMAISAAPVQARHQDRVEHADELAVIQEFQQEAAFVLQAQEQSSMGIVVETEAACCGGGGYGSLLTSVAECCGGGYGSAFSPPLDRRQRMVMGLAAFALLMGVASIRYTRKYRSKQWT